MKPRILEEWTVEGRTTVVVAVVIVAAMVVVVVVVVVAAVAVAVAAALVVALETVSTHVLNLNSGPTTCFHPGKATTVELQALHADCQLPLGDPSNAECRVTRTVKFC